MKITGTRTYIDVEDEGRVIRIQGEMIIGGFVAYKRSMTKWNQKMSQLQKRKKQTS